MRTKEFKIFPAHQAAGKSVEDAFSSFEGFPCPREGIGIETPISIHKRNFIYSLPVFPPLPNVDQVRILHLSLTSEIPLPTKLALNVKIQKYTSCHFEKMGVLGT